MGYELDVRRRRDPGGGGIPVVAVFPLVTVYPPWTKFSHGGMGGKEDKTGFSPSPPSCSCLLHHYTHSAGI